jgi:hypothetical protein
VRPRVGSAGFCRGATNDAGACARHVVGNGAVAAGGGEFVLAAALPFAMILPGGERRSIECSVFLAMARCANYARRSGLFRARRPARREAPVTRDPRAL